MVFNSNKGFLNMFKNMISKKNILKKFFSMSSKLVVALALIFQFSYAMDTSDRNQDKNQNRMVLSLLFSKNINEIEHLSEIDLKDFPTDRLAETSIWFRDIQILNICKTFNEVYGIILEIKSCPIDRFEVITSCLKNSGAPLKCNMNSEFRYLFYILSRVDGNRFGSIASWLETSNIVSKCSNGKEIFNLVELLNSISSPIFDFIDKTFLNNKIPLNQSVDENQSVNRMTKHIDYLQHQDALVWNNRLTKENYSLNNQGYQTFFQDFSGKFITINMSHGMLVSDFMKMIQVPLTDVRFLYAGRQIEFTNFIPNLKNDSFTRKEVTDFWVINECFPIVIAKYIFQYYPRIKEEQRLDLVDLCRFYKYDDLREKTFHLAGRLRAD